MHDMKIEPLSMHTRFISIIARLHFTQWKELTGASTEKKYVAMLNKFASTELIPTTLVAVRDNELLGSVNIVDCDMEIRSELYPWLAQLFVFPKERKKGIGSSLVRAAVNRCQRLGFKAVDLPILTQPNAGLPKFTDGQTHFDMTPEAFAKGITACLDAGAKLVGGCCGTLPEHIRCVAELLGKVKK